MSIIMKKYHGLGNDYLVLDPNKNEINLNEKIIKLICHRNFGAGSDGILYGPIIKDGKIKVRIYNPDGSEAEKSGNGIRIFSRFLLDEGYVTGEKFVLSTLGGDVTVEFKDSKGHMIKVDMGKALFNSTKIPVIGPEREVVNEEMNFNGSTYKVTCVNIGNPHCVILMDDISENKAREIGPYVENSINFPNRINMQLLKVLDRNNIQIEIYERGAGYTLASGTSSSAAAAAAYKLGLVDEEIEVHSPGGNLYIKLDKNFNVQLTGPVESVGKVELSEEFVEKF